MNWLNSNLDCLSSPNKNVILSAVLNSITADLKLEPNLPVAGRPYFQLCDEWKGIIPFCPGDFPRQYKRQCNIVSFSFTRSDSSSRQMDISTLESAFNIWPLFPFRRPFFHLLFLSPKSTGPQTSSWMLNSSSTIYNCPSSISTHSTKEIFVSSCH